MCWYTVFPPLILALCSFALVVWWFSQDEIVTHHLAKVVIYEQQSPLFLPTPCCFITPLPQSWCCRNPQMSCQRTTSEKICGGRSRGEPFNLCIRNDRFSPLSVLSCVFCLSTGNSHCWIILNTYSMLLFAAGISWWTLSSVNNSTFSS